jgi:hypothetical protein
MKAGPSRAELMEMKELLRKLVNDEMTKEQFDTKLAEVTERQLRLAVPAGDIEDSE